MAGVFRDFYWSFTVLSPDLSSEVLQVADEEVDLLFGDVLHDNNMCEFTTEMFVVTECEVVFPDNLGGRTTEEDGIAIGVDPCGIMDGIELLLEIGGTFEQESRLLCPSVVSNILDEPPELKGLDGISGAIDHPHIAVEVGDIKGVLVVIDIAQAEEQSGRAVEAEELMSADGDGVEAEITMVNHIAIGRKGQIPPKEGSVHVSIHMQVGIFIQHGVEGELVVDSPLEGRAHGIDHENGFGGVEHFLQFGGDHASHTVTFDESYFEVLQVANTHIGIVRLIRYIHDRHLASLVF